MDGCHHSGTNERTTKQGKIELLSQWTMDGWDEQWIKVRYRIESWGKDFYFSCETFAYFDIWYLHICPALPQGIRYHSGYSHQVMLQASSAHLPLWRLDPTKCEMRWIWDWSRLTNWTSTSMFKLGKPSRKKSAVFLNIVQKAFDPPLFRLNIIWWIFLKEF